MGGVSCHQRQGLLPAPLPDHVFFLFGAVFSSLACFRCRRGWLAAALPVSLKGIGGPGAPHVMHFVRRVDAGLLRSVVCGYLACHGTVETLHFKQV